MAAAPLPRLRLELEAASPARDSPAADASGPLSIRPDAEQRERRLRQRSRSGVDLGDVGSTRALRAGSPRRLAPRSASGRVLSGVGRVPSVDSSVDSLAEPTPLRPSPGSVRARLNRRKFPS